MLCRPGLFCVENGPEQFQESLFLELQTLEWCLRTSFSLGTDHWLSLYLCVYLYLYI